MRVKRTWHNIHPDFKLNGVNYKLEELFEVGYSLIKEGDAHEVPIGELLLDWISDSTTLEVHTSGSTGTPKRITLEKEYMVNSAIATGDYFDLIPGNTALLCLPSTGIAGKMMLVRAMVLGLELDYIEPSSTPMVNCNKSYDFVAMVPLQAENSLDSLGRISTLIIGGAPISAALLKNLRATPNSVYETYGMTETITHIAAKKLNDTDSEEGEDYFKVLPNVSITIDDRDCLVIEAPQISSEKVVTNDVVELISDSKFIWLGRHDSIINSGGVKLIPEQIEKKLSESITSRFFVIGVPDESLGQKLVLVIEDTQISSTDLLNQIKSLEVLHKFEVPKSVFQVEAFEETKSGKVNRKDTLSKALR